AGVGEGVGGGLGGVRGFGGFLRAAAAGALFSGFVKRVLYTTPLVIAVSFIAGGIVMLIAERYRPRPTVLSADRTPLARALGIGVCQTPAPVPGVSRAGATLVAPMLLGLQPPAAAEFSFLLPAPAPAAPFPPLARHARHALR